jgi:hypothetical protein
MWVEIVWGSLWASKILAKLCPFCFKHLIGVVSAETAKYATIISALEVPITLLGWSFVSFITFIPIMTRNPTQRALSDTTPKGWEDTLRQILAALTIIALVYLIQKALIQFVAVNFHKVSYEERITKNKHATRILARLYEHSRALFPSFTRDFHSDDAILAAHAHNRPASGTMTPTMKNVRKVVNRATSAFGAAAQEITGKQIFQTTSPYNTVVNALGSTAGCASLARRLWYSFVPEGTEVLQQRDLEDVFGNPEEAKEAIMLFDKVSLRQVALTTRTETEMLRLRRLK